MDMVGVVQVTTTLWTDLTGGGSEVDWKDGFLWDRGDVDASRTRAGRKRHLYTSVNVKAR
jgi:hypothetical protein